MFSTTKVDLGVFAHNEEAHIGALISDLASQTLLLNPEIDCRIYILANGCSDRTVANARQAIDRLTENARQIIEIHDIATPGKSKTWNSFAHTISRHDVDFLLFTDADIRVHQPNVLEILIVQLQTNPAQFVANSRPVKDLELQDRKMSFIERAIVAGGGSLNDWRRSICGQLYAIRAEVARRVWMPVGLPVEDGFLRAMVLTDCLTRDEIIERIDGDAAAWHEYESEKTLSGLIRHQRRIVIGSAINTMLFDVLRKNVVSLEDAAVFLKTAAADDSWLARTERQELPCTPYGFVPFSFATKRLVSVTRSGRTTLSSYLNLIAGVTLDCLVYVLASLHMARKGGADHW